MFEDKTISVLLYHLFDLCRLQHFTERPVQVLSYFIYINQFHLSHQQ